MSAKQPGRRGRALGDRDSSSVSVGLVLSGAALVTMLGLLAWLT